MNKRNTWQMVRVQEHPPIWKSTGSHIGKIHMSWLALRAIWRGGSILYRASVRGEVDLKPNHTVVHTADFYTPEFAGNRGAAITLTDDPQPPPKPESPVIVEDSLPPLFGPCVHRDKKTRQVCGRAWEDHMLISNRIKHIYEE